MKKTVIALTITAALVLSLTACGSGPTSENETSAAETQTAETATETQATNSMTDYHADGSAAATNPPTPATPHVSGTEPEIGRQDGERFEAVIILEGMEETVQYEHVINEAVGFEMDYDFESFVRRRESDRERFISIWDDPENPENYLEMTTSAKDADAVAASVSEDLSQEYELLKGSRELERAGSCIRIEASELKDNGGMADHLQVVYIIPAPDGCRVATAHFTVESAEGFGRRFSYMMNTLVVIGREEGRKLSDEQALTAIRNYCYANNPDLERIVSAGEHPVYWELSSGDEYEIVVLFRSYTGLINRYYIDPVSGETYVTEFIPGVSSGEERTEESLNVWEYLG